MKRQRTLQQIARDSYEYTARIRFSYIYQIQDKPKGCIATPFYTVILPLNNKCEHRYELINYKRYPKEQLEIKELQHYFLSEEYLEILQQQAVCCERPNDNVLFEQVTLPALSNIISVRIYVHQVRNKKSYASNFETYEGIPVIISCKQSRTEGSGCMLHEGKPRNPICPITVESVKPLRLSEHFIDNLSKLNNVLNTGREYSSIHSEDIMIDSCLEYSGALSIQQSMIAQENNPQGVIARKIDSFLSRELEILEKHGLGEQLWNEDTIVGKNIFYNMFHLYSQAIMHKYDLFVSRLLKIELIEEISNTTLYSHVNDLRNLANKYYPSDDKTDIKPLKQQSLAPLFEALYNVLLSRNVIDSKETTKEEFVYWMTGKSSENHSFNVNRLPIKLEMDSFEFILLFDILNIPKWKVLSQIFEFEGNSITCKEMKSRINGIRSSLKKPETARANLARLSRIHKLYLSKIFKSTDSISNFINENYRDLL